MEAEERKARAKGSLGGNLGKQTPDSRHGGKNGRAHTPAAAKKTTAATPEAPEFAADQSITTSVMCGVFFLAGKRLELGDRVRQFRLGGEQLLMNGEQPGTISVADLAVALLDETEQPQHIRQRFTLAY